MSHPDQITHIGENYTLTHMKQTIHSFEWKCEDDIERNFNVRVRYSDHCYSDSDPILNKPGCYIIKKPGQKDRFFCTKRFIHSISVPNLVEDIFKKPTTTISRTKIERNWSKYYLRMAEPMSNGSKYFMFIQFFDGELQRNSKLGEVVYIDMWVQSAYERTTPVLTDRTFPFGKVVDRFSRGCLF